MVWPTSEGYCGQNVQINILVKNDGTDRNRCTLCNLASSDLLMNVYRTPKTRSVWPTLWEKVPKITQKWVWIGIFEPAEPHGPWAACSILVLIVELQLNITIASWWWWWWWKFSFTLHELHQRILIRRHLCEAKYLEVMGCCNLPNSDNYTCLR